MHHADNLNYLQGKEKHGSVTALFLALFKYPYDQRSTIPAFCGNCGSAFVSDRSLHAAPSG